MARSLVLAGLAALALSTAATTLYAQSPATPPMMNHSHDHSGMTPEQMRTMMEQHHPGMTGHNMSMPGHMAGGTPSLPGQDAFGAIQEIVRILEADPNTDWSKVNLDAVRQHLIDMNEVTLHADAAATPIDGGLAIAVTGSGRTLPAIQRMVPAHAQEINGHDGWAVKAETLADGVRLTVTAADPKETAHIRGLGFIGIMASGSHHQPHHLGMAKGEPPHAH